MVLVYILIVYFAMLFRIEDLCLNIFFYYGKDKANERSGQLMVSDHRRPRPRATPEALQVRCRPLRWRYTRFLKVPMSYRPGNTAAKNRSNVS